HEFAGGAADQQVHGTPTRALARAPRGLEAVEPLPFVVRIDAGSGERVPFGLIGRFDALYPLEAQVHRQKVYRRLPDRLLSVFFNSLKSLLFLKSTKKHKTDDQRRQGHQRRKPYADRFFVLFSDQYHRQKYETADRLPHFLHEGTRAEKHAR